MRRINNAKKRVLRQLLNDRRPTPFSDDYAIRGFNKLFKTPTAQTYTILDDLVGTVVIQNPTLDAIKNLYYANRGKNIHGTYLIDGTDVIHRQIPLDFNVTIPNIDGVEFEDYWSGELGRFRVDSDTDIFMENDNQGKFYLRPQVSTATTARIKQSFLDGLNHCVFTPIQNWAETNLKITQSENMKKMYQRKINKIKKYVIQYVNGVPEDEAEQVCKSMNIKIKITFPFCDEEKIYGNSLINPDKVFNFINTRINHLDEGNFVINKKAIAVTRDNLYSKCDELDQTRTFYYVTKSRTGLSSVHTLTDVWRCDSEYMEVLNEFEKNNGLDGMRICDIRDAELAQFIHRGVHYNTSIDFNETHNNLLSKLIDQKKAYYNFKKCKFYEGFLGKITDFRNCNKIMGVGLYLITKLNFSNCQLRLRKKFVDLNNKMGCFQNNNVYTSAELNYLSNYGVKYTIVAGCWGIEPFHFDFGEEFLQKTDKKPYVNDLGEFVWKGISFYAKTAGLWDCHNTHYYNYIKGDSDYADVLKQNTQNLIIKYTDDNEICIGVPKKAIPTLSHISSFIFAYQRISLMEQLMEMELDKIQGIYVDGIYYKEHKFDLLDTFDYKDIDSDVVFRKDCFITNIFKTKPNIKYAKQRDNFKTELFIGAGGNGKTYFNLTDNGLVKVLYSAPTHKLDANKKEEFSVNVEVWASLLADNPMTYENTLRYYNVIVFDEVSMMANTEKQLLMKKYSKLKLIFCGDVGFQLPVISTWDEPKEEFKTDGFCNIREFTTNHRCKDSKLLEILNELRGNITEGYKTVPCGFVEKFNRIDEDRLKKNYKINDMIISGTNHIKDKYTQMFFELKKWYIIKKTKFNNNGDIIICEEQPVGAVIRHAYTAHSIQGETAKENLFIHAKSLQDIKGFYTAISRAKYYKQIYII